MGGGSSRNLSDESYEFGLGFQYNWDDLETNGSVGGKGILR